jgi:hypothetical protein
MKKRLCFVLTVVALGAGSCGVPRDGHPRPIADDRVPFELLDPTPATTAAVTTSVPAG